MSLRHFIKQHFDYDCQNMALFERAMRHRSAGADHNERLEFLGDAVLGAVVAKILFLQESHAPEGDLSRLRASLVNGESLATIADHMSLGEWVVLGSGEMKSGGHRRKSIQADVLEAVLGAIYLDGGYVAAEGVIRNLFAKRLENLPTPQSLKDPKTRLQEFLQARQQPLPQYETIEQGGPAHNPTFKIHASIEALGVHVQARAGGRRAAEQNAAQLILRQLTDE